MSSASQIPRLDDELPSDSLNRTRKLACLFLLVIFGIIFIAAIIVVSIQENDLETLNATIAHHREERNLSRSEPLGSQALPLTSMLIRPPSMSHEDLKTLISDFELRNRYNYAGSIELKNKTFENVVSVLDSYSLPKGRGANDKNTPHFYISEPFPDLVKLAHDIRRAIANGIKETSVSHLSPRSSSLHKDITNFYSDMFEKPKVNRSTMEDFMSKMEIIFDIVDKIPETLNVSTSVYEYLNLSTLQNNDESKEFDFNKMKASLWALNSLSPSGRSVDDCIPCGVNKSECYGENQKCNGIIDCSDLEDERKCSLCKNLLPKDSLCDGILDCLDGDDEKNCSLCSFETQFPCGIDEFKNPVCIPSSQHCDLHKDCENGMDERNCGILLPEQFPTPKITIYNNVPYTFGVLHWKMNDSTWLPLSLETETAKAFVSDFGSGLCEEIVGVVKEPSFTTTPSFSSSVSSFFVSYNSYSKIWKGYTSYNSSSLYFLNLNCGEPECSKLDMGSPSELVLRIVGGEETKPSSWSSVVGVYINGVFNCGGTIIDRYWILTAAHCFRHKRASESYVEVIGGMIRLSSRAPSHQIRTIDSIVLHGAFNSLTLSHDIALLRVSEPLVLNARVNSACLRSDLRPKVSDLCYTMGWGSTSEADASNSNRLLQVEVPIQDSCRQSYNNNSIQICGGYSRGGKDACQGDSGGPLYCFHSSDSLTQRNERRGEEEYYLAGIVSHGIGCARAETDGVYTRLSFYYNWIISVIETFSSSSKNKRSFLPNKHISSFSSSDFKLLSPSLSCPSSLSCDDGRCVSASHVCDGVFQCIDQRDEIFCSWKNGSKVFNGSRQPPSFSSSPPISPSFSPLVKFEFPSSTASQTLESPEKNSHIGQNISIYWKPSKCNENVSFTCRYIHECIAIQHHCDLVRDCIDGSDESTCTCRDFLKRKESYRVCDGIPDCPDSSDELYCSRCSSPHEFFCSFSKECISTIKVCDEFPDCKYREDERDCIALVPYSQNRIRLYTSSSSTSSSNFQVPLKSPFGFIALNKKGDWSPLCLSKNLSLNLELQNQLCVNLGYDTSLSVSKFPVDLISDKSFLNSPLHTYRYSRNNPWSSHRAVSSVSQICEQEIAFQNCSSSRLCGVHPLYSSVMGAEIDKYVKLPGLFPWHVNLYQNGSYICGASLIHSSWILTSLSCANKLTPMQNYVVARMGSFRDGPFLSSNEQIRQVVQFSEIPNSGISLGTFRFPVEFSNYVSPLCIPSSNSFSSGAQCFISGYNRQEGILNYGHSLRLKKICEVTAVHDYSICTEENTSESEICMEDWAGGLACKDAHNRYFLLGVYHTEKGGCRSSSSRSNGSSTLYSENKPFKFRSTSSVMARDAILKLLSLLRQNESIWYNGNNDCRTHRCILGSCLNITKICDGVPDCSDGSDEKDCENSSVSLTNHFKKCTSVNETHCACSEKEFLCYKSGMCIANVRFCDGIHDCSESEDEPDNCARCYALTRVLNSSLLCNGVIDCFGSDFGSDESAELCCSKMSVNIILSRQGFYSEVSEKETPSAPIAFRCLSENKGRESRNTIASHNECVRRESICDFCKDSKDSQESQCSNGSDDEDCISIWPRNNKGSSLLSRDIFGRFTTMPQGYLYFLAYGQRFLYCAGNRLFRALDSNENLSLRAANLLCRHEGYQGGRLIFHDTAEKTHIAFNSSLTTTNKTSNIGSQIYEDYKACKLVYLYCENPASV